MTGNLPDNKTRRSEQDRDASDDSANSGRLTDGLTPALQATDTQAVVIVHQRSIESAIDPLEELALLVRSAGARVVGQVVARRRRISAAEYFGKGTVEAIAAEVALKDASLVVVDHSISPIQERNLEQTLKCRVLDRTGLILDIFAQRASTAEGKLQVELAQLRYLSTRLVRGWTHLERQKGGIGLRGPGETQLETDRRLIGRRIRTLRERLERTERQRGLRRRGRRRVPIPTVSLVGYTNAGKSSLFNRLTNADVSVADQLFETLDPTMRRLDVRDFGPCVLSDTVGFVRDLPHSLVTAFHSTLEEVTQADLLLHVVDASSTERDDLITHVNTVLKEIKAENVPVVVVMNKIDLNSEPVRIVYDEDRRAKTVWVSAMDGSGLSLLEDAIASHLGHYRKIIRLALPTDRGRLHARLHERCDVVEERISDSGEWIMNLRVDDAMLGWIEAQSDYLPVFKQKNDAEN